MARDAVRQVQAFQWQQRPDEPEERDIAVDPFSLRQFSRLDIDRPLPIPSVSVADPHASPARLFGGGSAAPSPRASIAGRLNALAEVTGWDDDARPASSPVVQREPSVALPTSGKSAAAAGGEAELVADDGGGFDVALSSSGRKASEPQRWGSDVPLIAAAGSEDEEESSCYSFPNSRGKNGRGKARRAAGDAPLGCCMYVPGLSRRSRPPPPPPARSSSSGSAFAFAAAAAEKRSYPADTDPAPAGTARQSTAEKRHPAPADAEDPVATARQSTVSLAVSLERFDCESLSTSSWGDLDLDGGVSSSSCFDLPLELILGCDDDESDLPVCAAFVFDGDGIRRSVLKKRLPDGAEELRRPSLGRASTGASGRISGRHVRVSVKSRSPPGPTSP